MAQILLSTGASLAVNIHPITCRRMVEIGDATVKTIGATGFDVVQLVNPTKDTAYSAATFPAAPIRLGNDNIEFLSLTYPEAPLL